MQGKQHRQGNVCMSIAATLYLVLIKGFDYWYLIMPVVAWYVADFPDIDQIRTTPKRWKSFKQLLGALVGLVLLVSLAIVIYCVYVIFSLNKPLDSNMMYAFAAAVVALATFLGIVWYTSTDNGKFLVGHRGFTHTLIIPMAMFALYVSIEKVIDFNVSAKTDTTLYLINVLRYIACAVVLGALIGYIGHLFLDSLCKAGVPLLWPLSKSSISFGNAITSDKRAKDGTHISSKIYTYVVCAVSIIISCYIVYKSFVKY